MAFVRPLIDYSGNLQEVAVNDYIQPAILGAGTPSSNTILDGSGNWVTIANLNYWTLTGSDVYRASGKVFIGGTSSTGSSILQVFGDIYNSSLYGTTEGTVLVKAVNGVLSIATSADIASLLGTASNDYIKNQVVGFQSGNFKINGVGWASQLVATPSGGGGFVSITQGSVTQAGYFEIYNSAALRLAYIGFDNSNVTYVAENGANHVFLGNKTLIGSGATYGTQVFQVTGEAVVSRTLYTNLSNSDEFAIGLIVAASSHTTSKRAAINLGNFGQIVSDVYANGTNDFGLYNASGTWSLFIKKSNDYVGIGTTTPNVNLEVVTHIRISSGTDQYGYQFTNDADGTYFRLRYFASNEVYSNLITGVYTGIVIIGNDPSQNGTKTLQVNGGIRQNDVISGLVYANAQGEFQNATAANIASTLGAGNYIQNGTLLQTGNFNISGIGKVGQLVINKTANDYVEIYFQKAGILQFNLYSYTDGTNNLNLASYNDTGGYITSIFTANRLTGNINFGNNVGIGITNPLYKLDVNGIGRFFENIYIQSTTTASSARIGLYQTGSNWWYIENVFPGHLKFTRGSVDYAMFTNDGKFLVGTTSVYNGSLFQVNGSITQRGVLSKLIYADSTGQLIEATASHVAATLGAGNYIQNQYSSAQLSNIWISGNIKAEGVHAGGFGAKGTGGVTNWNDISNSTSGQGYTLLLANHTNGFAGGNNYFHPFNFEYSSRNGTGNITQLAIPYGYSGSMDEGMWIRGSYNGTWNAWQRILTQKINGNWVMPNGNVGIGTINPVYGKLHIIKDSAYNWESSAGIAINSADASGASELLLGTDGTNSFAFIQSVQRGVSYNHKLAINANGGVVVVGGSGSYSGFSIFQVHGSIHQSFVTSALVYANNYGVLTAATAQNVKDLLGTGSYIQNQFAGVQSSSAFWVGAGRVGSVTTTGNLPTFSVTGDHSTAHMSVYSIGNAVGNDASLDMWASEPGLTYDGVGIGNNVNSSPYYGRRNTSKAQSYIRFYNGHIYFSTSTTETINPSYSPMLLSNTGRLLLGYSGDVNTYKVQINSGSSSGAGLYVNGDIRASGNIIADGYFSGTSSDRIYKSDFKKISVYSVIDNINVSSYKHKLYDNKRLIGSVAQDIQKYFPELITEDNNGRLRVDNYGYAALALQLGKETKSEVEKLKERIKELENRLGI